MDLETRLIEIAEIQKNAGWSELSIKLYAQEIRDTTPNPIPKGLIVGAGLACDNTRFGVYK